MAGISIEIQMVLYAIFIIVMGFAGYYVGKMYGQAMIGSVIGIVLGLIVAGIIYKMMGSGEERMKLSAY